jgi:hypothetical protein
MKRPFVAPASFGALTMSMRLPNSLAPFLVLSIPASAAAAQGPLDKYGGFMRIAGHPGESFHLTGVALRAWHWLEPR